MTVEVDYGEKPAIIVSKKRTGGKKNGPTVNHVDHIIVVQGSSNMTSAKMYSLAEAGGIIEHHNYNGNSNPTKINGFKKHVNSDLPIIPDCDEKCDISPNHNENDQLEKIKPMERPQSLPRNGYNSNLCNSREIVDLSPIYENSSDACSSHDDVRSSNNDIVTQKSCLILHEDANDNNSLTPNSLSQTHSETSLEMSLLNDKHSMKKKKRVNIVSDANIHSDDPGIEIAALKCDSESSGSPEKSTMSNADGYLTMNGTIKRGKKKGQSVDVTLNMSREELEVLEANIVANEIIKAQREFKCSLASGVHIVLWTLICMPFVTIVSSIYSFYMGTLTWYNIFIHVSEGKNIWIRIFVSPVVILLYPFLILSFTVGLGLYAGIVQITYCGPTWWKEVCDFEKGFYGWFCGFLHLSDCSPYEVVILTDLKVVEFTDMRGQSSTEDLSI